MHTTFKTTSIEHRLLGHCAESSRGDTDGTVALRSISVHLAEAIVENTDQVGIEPHYGTPLMFRPSSGPSTDVCTSGGASSA